MDTPQCCIFIEDKAKVTQCFGITRKSGERFGIAPKEPFSTHWGVPAHAQGDRMENKVKVMVGAYYTLGGVVNGLPTAKVDPTIMDDKIYSSFSARCQSGMLTTSG